MVRWSFGTIALLATASVLACGLLVDIPDVTLAPSTDGGAVGDASSPRCARTPDGGPRKGTPMVEVVVDDNHAFCIDATEVTVAQFNEFILAGGSYQDAPKQCATAVPIPLVNNDPALQDHPQGSVGACPAFAYCRWAGKRLCGAIGDGGSVHSIFTPAAHEWMFACVNGKRNTAYPYGITYDASVCNTENDGSVAVGSKSGCHGIEPPFDRIYDMTGNAHELMNEFEDGDDSFGQMGGGYSTVNAACDTREGVNGYLFYFESEGFRCCADPR